MRVRVICALLATTCLSFVASSFPIQVAGQDSKPEKPNPSPRVILELLGLDAPPGEENDIVVKWTDRSTAPATMIAAKWKGGASMELPKGTRPPITIESSKHTFTICDAEEVDEDCAILRYVAWQPSEVEFKLQMPDGTPVDYSKVDSSAVHLWPISKSACRSRHSPTLKPKEGMTSLNASSGKYAIRASLRIKNDAYLAHLESDIKPGKQSLVVRLSGPVTWSLHDIVDETGKCSGEGILFANCATGFRAIARAVTVLGPSGRTRLNEEFPDTEPKGYAESRLLSFEYMGGILGDSSKPGGKAYFPSIQTGTWMAVTPDRTGIYYAILDSQSKKVTIKALPGAASLVVSVNKPEDGAPEWKSVALNADFPFELAPLSALIAAPIPDAPKDGPSWPREVTFHSLPADWYFAVVHSDDGKDRKKNVRKKGSNFILKAGQHSAIVLPPKQEKE